MDALQVPEEGEPLFTFRVGVDFSVGARDVMEARALLERTLDAEDSDGTSFVTRTHRLIDEQSWGVADWQHVPPRPSQAALVQEKYPGLVGDLAVIEGLTTLVRHPGNLPEQTTARIGEILTGLEQQVMVEDPDTPSRRIVYEGPASQAAGHLNEGVYRAFDYDDREYALVVAPSELTASGRVSAAIPKERNDARALDDISRLLQEHTARQPLAELVRQVSGRMTTTRRAGFPSWVPLAGEPELPPKPPAHVHIGIITWSDLPDVEPTVLADTNSVRLARTLATTLHEVMDESDAFAGATEFLRHRPGPAQWQSAQDVDTWLEALRATSPFPAFSLHQVTVTGTAGPDMAAGLAHALEARAAELGAPTDPEPPRPPGPPHQPHRPL